MTNEMLESAVTLAKKVGYVFIATADSQGMPHVTAAAQIASFDGGVAVIDMNRRAAEYLNVKKEILIIPGATHLFEEPGALEKVASAAGDWFVTHL